MTPSVLTKKQVKEFRRENSRGDVYVVRVRYDDSCGNGHNTFAITCDVYDATRSNGDASVVNTLGKRRWLTACGGMHSAVRKYFRQLAPLIKWHGCTSEGPMHYVGDTVYHAGDRDHNHKRKGEPWAWGCAVMVGNSPIAHKFESKKFWAWLWDEYNAMRRFKDVVEVSHPPTNSYKLSPKYTFDGYQAKWHECPFDSRAEAEQWKDALAQCVIEFIEVPTLFSNGKERDLDAARNTAIWPDATDADLTEPGLEDRLKARLPELMAEFRKAVESLGFVY